MREDFILKIGEEFVKDVVFVYKKEFWLKVRPANREYIGFSVNGFKITAEKRKAFGKTQVIMLDTRINIIGQDYIF